VANNLRHARPDLLSGLLTPLTAVERQRREHWRDACGAI